MSKDLAKRLGAAGIALLDAPVSGGPAKAAAGTMTMMVSGDEAALARVRGMLGRIADRVFVLGARAGDASTYKIVNNLLAGANLAAAAEALALAHAAGLDLEQVRDVVNASSAEAGSLPIGSRARCKRSRAARRRQASRQGRRHCSHARRTDGRRRPFSKLRKERSRRLLPPAMPTTTTPC
jgi:3-hydroxyisobutyrate dehydrogenase-like beta-hydroxyacid dehydrogenase